MLCSDSTVSPAPYNPHTIYNPSPPRDDDKMPTDFSITVYGAAIILLLVLFIVIDRIQPKSSKWDAECY
jgi:hypothetical protein